ncbi:transport and Golgi organization protein 6 [Anopheles nili]|uniref:transport and Golgi organization protein 6 n=1 Tax=Anopheles nili TaxID=185578 RepID=UPI00237A3EC4|nr:transport and Golgi organization protein 6 [Anopheles nili]
MEAQNLREVLVCTAKLKAKDITLTKLQDCLNAVKNSPFPPSEATTDMLWRSTILYYTVLVSFADYGLMDNQEQTCDMEAMISLNDQSVFLATMDLVRQFSLHLYLPRELRGITNCETQLMVLLNEQERVRRLLYCVTHFERLFQNNMIATQRLTELGDCSIDYIAAVYSLSKKSPLADKKMVVFSKETIFRSLMMIKGAPGLPETLSLLLHRDLLFLTGESGGFSTLCRVIHTGDEQDNNVPTWQKSEIVAKIVASKGHTKSFYRQVLTECLKFYDWSVEANTKKALIYAETCIACLKRFCDMPVAYRELYERIETHFLGCFQSLAHPEELIASFVVGERAKLIRDLHKCHRVFTGATFTCLPSSLLVSYIQMFLKLYMMLPDTLEEHRYLYDLIVFCLSNRSKQELMDIIQCLLYGSVHSEKTKYLLHSRIVIKHNEASDDYILHICPLSDDDHNENDSLLPVLVDVLKSSNRNLLNYDVFLILLNELMPSTWINEMHEEQHLHEENEREELFYSQICTKYILIQALTDLVNYKGLHSQLYDNPNELLNILMTTLSRYLQESESTLNSTSVDEKAKVLEIVISIFCEFLHRTRSRPEVDDILKLLQRYRRTKSCSDSMKVQIDLLCDGTLLGNAGQTHTAYQNALSLCADQQPYCKVFGTTLLIKLIKERDPETIAQRQSILILALVNLREDDSYAFLNSVRLLVALCNILEADVVDTLLKEYLNEDNEQDYRLKIGEATVKTVETLGPLAIRYRDVLMNCFLIGTRHSINVLRVSSLSNIGIICRILSYQVHNFFYELFMCIKSIVETDSYLPARRAAILVLSQLFEGIQQLMDHQDHLLLIYRFLKLILATDKDDVTKLQAAIALDHLKTKAKDFLQISSDSLEKNIFGKII